MSAERFIYHPEDPREVVARMDRLAAGQSTDGETPVSELIRICSPSEFLAYQEPPGHNLVGDYFIQRGAITILAGAPGVFKSRAILWLGILGGLGKGDWFNLPVHCQYRTLILQNENGPVRLHRDFKQLKAQGKLPDDIDSWLYISEPPPRGMVLDDIKFRLHLCEILKKLAPRLLIVDPWNGITRDITEREFHLAFGWLREVLAACPEPPACLIVHHTRKPRPDERAKGRDKLHQLAGSFTLGSVARSAMIIERVGGEDLEDQRIVALPVKSNDSDAPCKPSAWDVRDGGFVEIPDFDWEAFNGTKPREPTVRLEHLHKVFEGVTSLQRSDAAKKLMRIAGVGKTVAYAALKTHGGRFSDVLRERRDHRIRLIEDDIPDLEGLSDE
jgi:AAA domain